jgi:hypothetical protein
MIPVICPDLRIDLEHVSLAPFKDLSKSSVMVHQAAGNIPPEILCSGLFQKTIEIAHTQIGLSNGMIGQLIHVYCFFRLALKNTEVSVVFYSGGTGEVNSS